MTRGRPRKQPLECSVDDCHNKAICKRLCSKHYIRMVRDLARDKRCGISLSLFGEDLSNVQTRIKDNDTFRCVACRKVFPKSQIYRTYARYQHVCSDECQHKIFNVLRDRIIELDRKETLKILSNISKRRKKDKDTLSLSFIMKVIENDIK